MAKKIVSGIDMTKVKADEVKAAIKAFNEAKLGVTCKAGANPLGMAKAFTEAVEAVHAKNAASLPEATMEYYNKIVADPPQTETPTVPAEADEPGEPEEPKVAPKAKANPTKAKATPPAPKAAQKPKAAPKAKEGPTKKSIIVAAVSKAKGASVEEMAQACVDAGLGDMDTNMKTVKLWLRKLDFKVVADAKGKFRKTE